MTVNVYTYYENKLALEKAQRSGRSMSRRRILTKGEPWFGTFTKIGMVAGLFSGIALCALGLDPESSGLASLALALWGGGVGRLLDNLGDRCKRFFRALRGEPLDAEELRQLVASA